MNADTQTLQNLTAAATKAKLALQKATPDTAKSFAAVIEKINDAVVSHVFETGQIQALRDYSDEYKAKLLDDLGAKAEQSLAFAVEKLTDGEQALAAKEEAFTFPEDQDPQTLTENSEIRLRVAGLPPAEIMARFERETNAGQFTAFQRAIMADPLGDMAAAIPAGYRQTVLANRLEAKFGNELAEMRNDAEALRAVGKVAAHARFIFGKGPMPPII